MRWMDVIECFCRLLTNCSVKKPLDLNITEEEEEEEEVKAKGTCMHAHMCVCRRKKMT